MSRSITNRAPRALIPTRWIARGVIAVAIAGGMGACDVHGVSGPGVLASITVTPNATLAAASTQQMLAIGYDGAGEVVSITPTWSVVASGGSINAAGVFTAGSTLGLFANTVVASVGSVSGRASITVTSGPLVAITVTPNPVTMGVTTTQQFIGVGTDASGNIVQFTPTWSVVAGGGTISQTGVFTAGAVAGTYANTIQVSGKGLIGTATVIVTPGPLASITVTPNPATLTVGMAQLFTAVGKDASGNVVPMTAVWSAATASGTITTFGVFTAGSTPGTFANAVTATSGSISGTATVVITAGPLVTITVTPNPASMAIGATQQFTAVGTDVGGNVLPITPTWTVVAGGGTINATGLFTAGTAPGTYVNSVRASVGSLAGFATVNVTGGGLATITVTPNPVTTTTNGVVQFVAVGTDVNGNVFLITPTWSIVNGGGTINPTSGGFSAGTVSGTFTNTVKATSGNISGFATVIVNGTAPSLASITVTPNPATVLINATQLFTAVGMDGNGNIFPISPTWSVVNGGGTINSSTGVFTASAVPGTYPGTVKASSGVISGVATVIVAPALPVLTTITVTKNPDTTGVNGTSQFVATGRDQFGNPFVITPVWSVVNGGGTINSGSGLFTAGAIPGTYTGTVKAASGGVSGVATVVVTAAVPVLTTITVTPNPDTTAANGTQQFSAAGKDQFGNPFVFTPVWSVINGGGTIDPVSGLFTAGAAAGTFTNTVQATSGLVSGTATVVVPAVFMPIVNLASDSLNGILAGTAVSCTGTPSTINANVAVSPGTAPFTPVADLTGPCIVTGTEHLSDPTAAQNQLDITPVYNNLFDQTMNPCPAAHIEADVGGMTLLPGVYCSGSSMALTGTVILNGNNNPNAVFVFQVGSALTVNTAGTVILENGAKARNVYWVVGSSATLNGAQFNGNIVALTSITLNTGTNLIGRALARNGAVTVGTTSTIILPP